MWDSARPNRLSLWAAQSEILHRRLNAVLLGNSRELLRTLPPFRSLASVPRMSEFIAKNPSWQRLLALITAAASVSLNAQHQIAKPGSSYNPKVAPASDAAEQAIKRFVVTPGLKVDLFAAEPHLANPVAFCFDEKGRVYVAETFRHSAGVGDIRGIMSWLDDELASRSVDDRMGYMKHRLGAKVGDWMRESERVKLLEDRDGDGRIDHSSVFADGFNSLLDGIGSGVLARKGNVYFANIPNLWLLRDNQGTGSADFRKSLSHGYGVRIGFLGHDLHGLRFGPDGKLYFSCGDRGSNVMVEGRSVGHTDMGDVFRCNPDGSELEVFATGLRNPQELAFDQYGNLFTGDNNSDSGDKARWVYLVEGGDSGWRVGYQFMEAPYSRGPFNAEKVWYPQADGQPAHIVPPITNITAGPSGLTYYPGTGLPAKYNEHFFLTDFHGSDSSRVHSFKLNPKGASFEVVDADLLVKGLLATDVEFGVDGGVYVSDWVAGWDKTGRGRIYRFHDPEIDRSAAVLQTKRLLAEGMEKRSASELAKLLTHQDMRVRLEAQFELADRGSKSIKILTGVAARSSSQLARLHAIWGLGQIAANTKTPAPKSEAWPAIETLLGLLDDADVEVRSQAAKLLGERRIPQAFQGLIGLLHDSSPRVRFFAATSLGKLGRSEAVQPILEMLRQNADQDPYLRHAGVMGLAGIGDMAALMAAATDKSPAARMGVLLAMRRLERSEIALFLNDPDPRLVVEAARAINDQPINGAKPELARFLGKTGEIAALPSNLQEPLLRRAINASLQVGTREAAETLVRFATLDGAATPMRVEALTALADWERPSGRDRVIGLWRPVPSARDPLLAPGAFKPALNGLLASAPTELRVATVRAAERLKMTDAAPALFAFVKDDSAPESVRLAALKALATFAAPQFPDAARLASAASSEALRKEATRLQAKLQSSDALEQLRKTLETGSTSEKQVAFEALNTLSGESSEALLTTWMDRLIAGKVPPEAHLDLLQAAGSRSTPLLKEKIALFESNISKADPLAPYRVALHGGDATAGRNIFLERQDAACSRCHKHGKDGGEVGPELTAIGSAKDRDYILEALVLPNKMIAAGFENLLVTTKDGTSYAGILKAESPTDLTLNSAEDGLMTIKKSEVKSRERGLSAMPEGLATILSKRELRDVIEFLATSKNQ